MSAMFGFEHSMIHIVILKIPNCQLRLGFQNTIIECVSMMPFAWGTVVHPILWQGLDDPKHIID